MMNCENTQEKNSTTQAESIPNSEMTQNKELRSESVQAGPSNVEPQSDIYKLNVDCFHEIFEYFSFHDLMAVAQTSKRLQQVAGDFYRSYYVSKKVTAQNGGISTMYSRSMDIFSRYITSVYFSCNGLKTYRFIGTNCKSLRHIWLHGSLPERGIEYMRDVLAKIENIDLDECFFRYEFYNFFLKHCITMKSLSVRRSLKVRNKSIIIGDGNDWLQRKYPTLENIELTELYKLNGNELKTFFVLNPNVRTFSTDSPSLWENRETFLTCDVKLDKLAVEFTSKDVAVSVVDLLVELFERGFFKRLHVYSAFGSQRHLERMLSLPLAQSLEMLHINQHDFANDVCLENVTVLGNSNYFHLENLPEKLPNLERVYFYEISTDDILPLIKYSPKLRTIKIFRLIGGTFYKNHFDLSVYNMERAKLKGARKVTIYIDEYFVMQPHMDYKLVKLERFDWFDWKQLSSKFRCKHLSYY